MISTEDVFEVESILLFRDEVLMIREMKEKKETFSAWEVNIKIKIGISKCFMRLGFLSIL